ncbi:MULTISPECIES: right-handed parallel beta-helix repeat-containing protein [unclassified Cryobacterium]|uniref:right-handed parallel beta-helix repeat-containing protein n=1 Tax=unclassified Cryobacterium TaxID=2649013 RepID=UPI001069FF0F|nr:MULTISPECIES: right-handed parallel beta-helix repeat-containing protein [unclassified Cryobacterium]TFB96366.1 right-handed parallel beta-helix repeat-containing protein [Cryobacterium sp. MDB2-A-1]TFC03320.1 right-handed parallel beta-helix repeat-containing protein [Cryobacterium sp. MDB2-33-2]TFC12650.1 right-handed parallel beta-helix repeat-containing protein [Cryobacterium sp. MDB2-A-2]TFC17044.1 right-handed parallel beta-helix repeat-containing protein [Cryobacterium sp. MDB2-10]
MTRTRVAPVRVPRTRTPRVTVIASRHRQSGRPPGARFVLLGMLAGILAGVLAAALILVATGVFRSPTSAFGRAEIARNGNVQGVLYPGDPTRETSLVNAEKARLSYVRSVSASAQWRVAGLQGPYRLTTGSSVTLVLPARAQPYLVSDLLTLAPTTFVRQPDGGYLLSENIVVLTGATLSLTATDGLTLRLRSDPSTFVSVIGLGGSVLINGTATAPVAIESWNTRTGAVDTDTSDGRAYLRMIDGTVSVGHARIANLGFWSGETGGLALSGTDASGTDRSGADGSVTADASGTADASAPAGAGPLAGAPLAGAPVLPPELLRAPAGSVASSGPSAATLSAGFQDVTIDGNAFGLFITHAAGVTITDTRIMNSLVDGLVFHRFVTDTTVTRTSSVNSGVDGFTVARSSSGIMFDQITATDNGRNGVSIDGRSLADGPSAIGTGVESFGSSTVTRSTVEDNRRYGIELSGGQALGVYSSLIARNDMGIVLDDGASGVVVAGNTLKDQARQSIAIRDRVTDTSVRNNAISGSQTGVYVRNAGASVTDNTIRAVSNHAVSLVGDARSVRVVSNALSGSGAVPVWDETSSGAVVAGNNLAGWQRATTAITVARFVFQPLTVVWLLLALLLLVTALTRSGPQFGAIRHPYAERVPLTSLSRGIVSRESVGGAP